jgi:DNA-binding CsgD family transcriptional regulator/pimeloyl-ACP methyl ester carboxylesterase
MIALSPMPYSNIQKEWDFQPTHDYYEDLGKTIQFIRYDCRGSGLSDRDVTDFSLGAHGRDILAVANALGLERFALLGFGHSGGVAISFAANHPKRVSHLVLWCCYPKAADYGRGPHVKALQTLMDEDWEFWTRAEAFRLSEYEGGRVSSWFVEYVRESLTEEGSKAAVKSLMSVDVTDEMPKVQCPALVLHRTGIVPITVDMAKQMATAIPNARLMLFDGTWIVPFIGGSTNEIAAAIKNFVGGAPARSAAAAVAGGPLTPRETEVLKLIAAGRTSAEISHELSLSIRTVGRHITNIYAKIGARTRADATAYVIRHGIK